MKYKVGDKVRITDNVEFTDIVQERINDLNPNRIVTIKEIHPDCGKYSLNEIIWYWEEEWLKEIPEEIFDPITSRFEIMDL
jgi:hypothetical protein